MSIAQGGVTATFAYGPEGQRFRKIRNASQTTWWLGADLEVLPDGTPSAVY